MSPSDLLAAALEYVCSGRRVFPLGVRSKRPIRTTAEGGHGVHDATLSEAVVSEWWAANPRANIGIACGPASDLLVIDVDGPVGRDELAALERQHGPLPPTRHVTSGRDDGGTHYWFLWPSGVEATRGKLGERIDVLGRGRYVVAPPSVHPSGRCYRADDIRVADAPPWLVRLVAKHPTASKPSLPHARVDDASVRRARAYLDQVPGAVSGEHGHDHTFHVACVLVEGFALPIATARSLMWEWNEKCQPPWSEAELEHKLTDAAAQVTRPGYLLEGRGGVHPERPRSTSSASARPAQPCTDLGNARRLVIRHGKDLRWTLPQDWLTWTGKQWRRDETRAFERCAKDTVRSIWDEVKHSEGHEQVQLRSWAVKSQHASRLAAMAALARSEPEIAARQDDFDSHPMLVNLQNGTMDLATGELSPPRREDLLTRIAAARLVPEATSPLWDRFLERVLPDAEVRAFVQRYLGSALSGSTEDQAFVVFHGSGANGKTVLTEVVSHVLGDYASVTPFETLTAKRDNANAPSPDLADLVGTRLLLATEPSEGARLNVALVKQLTGGDRIKARHLHRDLFEFKPQFKLVLVGNHRPEIPEATHAAWRRVHLVPFEVQIPAAERDRHLTQKLLAERDGVLRWLLAGHQAWKEKGLCPPPAVVAATEEYRTEEDALGDFLAERCLVGDAYAAPATPLYQAYRGHAEAAGLRPETQRWFGLRLAERGFRKLRRGTVSWFGLAIRPPDMSPAMDHVDLTGLSPELPPIAPTYKEVLETGPSRSTRSTREPGEEG